MISVGQLKRDWALERHSFEEISDVQGLIQNHVSNYLMSRPSTRSKGDETHTKRPYFAGHIHRYVLLSMDLGCWQESMQFRFIYPQTMAQSLAKKGYSSSGVIGVGRAPVCTA